MIAAKRRKRKTTARKPASSLTERVARLEERLEIMGETISSINRSVATASDMIGELNGSLQATIAWSRDAAHVLTTFIVALRDILIAKGVVTAEEAIECLQIADLESMLDRPSHPPNDSDGQSCGATA